ncbi:MAG: hypothetical protein FWF57_05490 [Defluviitaleaceae bacterium]|nr:hypothetical protein [Defluviitaleaceae bacterium]
MKIGNMDEDGAEKINKKFNSNMVIRILRKHGFKWFLDRKPELESEEFVSICDLCNTLLEDKNKFYEEFEESIEEEKQNICRAYIKERELAISSQTSNASSPQI